MASRKTVGVSGAASLSRTRPVLETKSFAQVARDFDNKANAWMSGKLAPALYKMNTEYNPLTKAVTSLGSSISGIDMTMPKLDKGSGSRNLHMSGKKLSPERRATLGVMGVTGLAGIGLGGVAGVMTDAGSSVVGDIANDVLDTENASEYIKTGIGLYNLGQGIKNKDMNKVAEEGANIINIATEKLDERISK